MPTRIERPKNRKKTMGPDGRNYVEVFAVGDATVTVVDFVQTPGVTAKDRGPTPATRWPTTGAPASSSGATGRGGRRAAATRPRCPNAGPVDRAR